MVGVVVKVVVEAAMLTVVYFEIMKLIMMKMKLKPI